MTLTVEAISENGVLKPTEPLPLKEHEKVAFPSLTWRFSSMRSPFPGMDPFIESFGLWGDFHNSSHYDRDLDCHRPLQPPLCPSDAAWLQERLREQCKPT